ncbi:MAG: tetratricopeptide repeat protein [Bacteroidia bacterium]
MRKIFVLICAISIVYACQSPKEKMIDEITKLENSDSAFSITQISDLYWNYASFVEKYPDDERAPEFLFKAAQRSSILNKAKEGIGFFEKLIVTYPNSKYCEQALFSIAFSYENNLNDFDKARVYYNQFLQKYPNSELAEDAKLSIENLGKSDEEFLESINKDSTLESN